MCLAQRHNAVTPVRLEPAAPQSRVKLSTTEPLRSHWLLVVSSNYLKKIHDFSIIIQVFFKFHDFSMHGTFFAIFQVFHDFQSSAEPCLKINMEVMKTFCILVYPNIGSCLEKTSHPGLPSSNTTYGQQHEKT